MRYLLGALAFIFSFYALVVVTLNNQSTTVDLLYLESTKMTFGSALVISISVGMVIGFLIAVFYFEIYHTSHELKRLKKDNSGLKVKLEDANKKIETQSKTLNVVEDTVKQENPKPKEPPKKKEMKVFGYTVTWMSK